MCIFPSSLGPGKSTINVLGVGSGTGESVGMGHGGACGEQEEKLKNWAVRITQTLMTALPIEAQKGRRKSGVGIRGVLLPFLPFLPSPPPF